MKGVGFGEAPEAPEEPAEEHPLLEFGAAYARRLSGWGAKGATPVPTSLAATPR